MTLLRISTLDLLAAPFLDRLGALLVDLGSERIPLRVFETARSPQRQLELYARGRDPDGADYGRTVTRARAYQSAHQYGLAVDLVFFDGVRWSWEEPEAGMWDRRDVLAARAGLEVLPFERPHVQMAGFDWRHLTPGPADTAGWMAWLRRATGIGVG